MTRNRLCLALALFLPALFIALPAVSSPLGLATALTAGLAVALVASAHVVHLEPAASPAQIRTVSLRERARLTVFLRLRDPDSRGRTRPRAPSIGSAAA